MRKNFFSFILASIFSANVFASTFTCIATGNWNDGPTTWGTGVGVYPVAGDVVNIFISGHSYCEC